MKMASHFTRLGATTGIVVLGGIGLLAGVSGVAFAASGGYGTQVPASNAPGGFSTVVASQTVSSSGGTVSASSDGATANVVVPAGDFTTPTQITLSAPSNLSHLSGAVTGLRVMFSSAAGSLAHPIVVTISDPSIVSNDVVDEWNGSAFVPYSSATVSAGKVVIQITSDPTFVVTASSSSSAPPVTNVPGATSVTTGEPFIGEALLAGGLVLIGGVLFTVRRRSAARRI